LRRRSGRAREPQWRRAPWFCNYSKRIGDAPPLPMAETHGPVVETESAEADVKAAAKPVVKKAAKKGGKKVLQTA